MFEVPKKIINLYRELLVIIKSIATADDSCKTAIATMQCFSTGKQSFNTALEYFINLVETHDTLNAAVDEIDKNIADAEKYLGELDGIDGKVVFARDVEHKSLELIASELGYSLIYIKKISARNKKYTFCIPTKN